MDVLSVLNLKGGVGKTTIAMNLAAALAEHGYEVAVVDFDPQQSATRWSRQGECPVRVEAMSLAGGAKRFRTLLQEVKVDIAILDCPPELSDPAMVAALLSKLV
jgi:chromosome partitioning protein